MTIDPTALPKAGLRSCGDCAAKPGDEHSGGCDVAR
jgi:hypothetical protein